jgi:hypothetical protein
MNGEKLRGTKDRYTYYKGVLTQAGGNTIEGDFEKEMPRYT